MSTNTALDQIKNRVEGRTDGPWTRGQGITPHIAKRDWVEVPGHATICSDVRPADAELIAAAPKLLAALEAVEALLAEKYKLWAAVCSETCVKDHHGIDHDAIADNIATNIRSAIEEALR